MNRCVFTALVAALALPMSAQSDKRLGGRSTASVPGTNMVNLSPSTGLSAQPMSSGYLLTPATSYAPMPVDRYGLASASQQQAFTDTTYYGPEGRLPADDRPASYPAPYSTYYTYGTLHEGLNASLDLSVFAEFGKNARSGAGFGQRLSATWLQPLGKRGWLAAGGYINHINCDGASITTGGIQGQLGYQSNDHWSGYVYGQKSIVNNGITGVSPYYWGRGMYGVSPYIYNELGDKLGAALRWSPSRSFYLEVSVEKNWYPHNTPTYFAR